MNIAEVLETLSIDYRSAGESPHVTQGWIGVRCVWCDNGKGNYGLGIRTDTGACRCWSCGNHSLAEALVLASGQPWPTVLALLKGMAPERLKEPLRKQGKLALPQGIGPLLPCHRGYLKGRGFDPDELTATWGVQGIGLSSRLSWRVFIPIALPDGTTASWTTRGLTNDPPRYVNAKPEEEAFPAKELLYGECLAFGAVVVVEGPTDAWRIGPGAVATLGVVYSSAQVRRIAAFPSRTVCFDAEPNAQARARRLCSLLSVFPGKTRLVELDAADPGSASKREIQLLRRTFL